MSSYWHHSSRRIFSNWNILRGRGAKLVKDLETKPYKKPLWESHMLNLKKTKLRKDMVAAMH